jgi:hypothetical protein
MSSNNSSRAVISLLPLVSLVRSVDSDGNLRIYELGHNFSSNVGLEQSIENLMTRLRTIYKHIYVSGDYHKAMRIGRMYSINTRCVEVLQCVLKMLLKLSVVQTIKPSVWLAQVNY